MREFRYLLGVALLGAVLGLTGCAGTAAGRIAQAEVALTAAERAALAYVVLPACALGQAAVTCSDPSTVAKIKASDTFAFTAVMAAKDGKVSPDDALAAVSALTTIIPVSK
jgi:uncharacterized membrane protein YtjA (UPF0391 family)